MKKNHFELFGLPAGFRLNLENLERHYREIQARVHPDKFAHAGEAERRASLLRTTQVNEAYRVLKSAVQRAKYLLELHGVDVAFETDTSMPEAFLVRQLELRERLEAAKDESSLDALRRDLQAERSSVEAEIEGKIDAESAFESARPLVRKLMFLERLGEEIDAAYEALG